ncbi:MAG: hypothetical protein ACD_43C00157G0003 [uncultured bacterium]|nr:MAG: hypothetical protein ACD_43C00157G0003 [uncultured bacterium]
MVYTKNALITSSLIILMIYEKNKTILGCR